MQVHRNLFKTIKFRKIQNVQEGYRKLTKQEIDTLSIEYYSKSNKVNKIISSRLALHNLDREQSSLIAIELLNLIAIPDNTAIESDNFTRLFLSFFFREFKFSLITIYREVESQENKEDNKKLNNKLRTLRYKRKHGLRITEDVGEALAYMEQLIDNVNMYKKEEELDYINYALAS